MARNTRTTKPAPVTVHPILALAEAFAQPAEPKARKSVVPDAYKTKYAQSALKGTCADELAQAFADAAPKGSPDQDGELRAIAQANDVDYGKWAHLNIGMRRMNLSNVLRNRAKNGHPVTVGGHLFNQLAAAA